MPLKKEKDTPNSHLTLVLCTCIIYGSSPPVGNCLLLTRSCDVLRWTHTYTTQTACDNLT